VCVLCVCVCVACQYLNVKADIVGLHRKDVKIYCLAKIELKGIVKISNKSWLLDLDKNTIGFDLFERKCL